MSSVRVFVATTEGPSEVQRIAEEDPEVRSVVCLNGTSEALPISAAYDAFVRKPTGVIERGFGHPVFRMDVSARISNGRSWQFAAYAAHALHAAGRLARRGEQAGQALWLTGTVDSELKVGPVGHVAEKLARSQALFADLAAAGTPVTVMLSQEDARALEESALAVPPGVEVMAVARAGEISARFGLAAKGAAKPKTKVRIDTRALARLSAVALLVFAAAAAAGYWQNDLKAWWKDLAASGTTTAGENAGNGVVAEVPPAAETPEPAPMPEPDPGTGPEPHPEPVAAPASTPAPVSEPEIEPEPEPTLAPETVPSVLERDGLALRLVERRAAGGKTCGMVSFGAAGLVDGAVHAAEAGGFPASRAVGICAVRYEAENVFDGSLRLWMMAAPVGRQWRAGAPAVASVNGLVAPGETLSVEVGLPAWNTGGRRHRIVAVAADPQTAAAAPWLEGALAEIGQNWDFARWADLRERIEASGLVVVAVSHEITP